MESERSKPQKPEAKYPRSLTVVTDIQVDESGDRQDELAIRFQEIELPPGTTISSGTVRLMKFRDATITVNP